jgi:hypothetical protein
MEKVATQPAFEECKPTYLHVLLSRPKSIKGFPFEFELGRKLVQELRSSVEGSKDLMT